MPSSGGRSGKSGRLDRVLSVGTLSAEISGASGVGEHFSEKAALVTRLRELTAEHKIMTILVKGSRSAAMEVVVRALQENGTC
ncbi:UDP-N-acetylmuramoyl-tripeptide--D-alanyl-D-alanine ligase [Klebsiella michiganensis]|uniref:UDP-N-acetylmuramoyl-tripeptide--D-alanyl-D-alanine ligase n=1 Tax=Klebsiella michiganensis TaxID=1134687 RepID=A0A7H4M006_9ENTR|nr:UDP-N-acetylmuramoyl-tripeptide--D-alanyl-D-alanine ligase [Klebsiella michiganensis]